ncbi:hypothetical protein AGMMS49936_06640 [Endomicrobiia bacterium]|nr:hypothetical protein AGMMS49936_06640 [Endomicrobiia bacterium]
MLLVLSIFCNNCDSSCGFNGQTTDGGDASCNDPEPPTADNGDGISDNIGCDWLGVYDEADDDPTDGESNGRHRPSGLDCEDGEDPDDDCGGNGGCSKLVGF